MIGATNAEGTDVADRPVTVPDLFCSFCHALGINPRFAAARADLGWALLAQSRSDEADVEFARALEDDPLLPLPRQELEWRELLGTRRQGTS